MKGSFPFFLTRKEPLESGKGESIMGIFDYLSDKSLADRIDYLKRDISMEKNIMRQNPHMKDSSQHRIDKAESEIAGLFAELLRRK